MRQERSELGGVCLVSPEYGPSGGQAEDKNPSEGEASSLVTACDLRHSSFLPAPPPSPFPLSSTWRAARHKCQKAERRASPAAIRLLIELEEKAAEL